MEGEDKTGKLCSWHCHSKLAHNLQKNSVSKLWERRRFHCSSRRFLWPFWCWPFRRAIAQPLNRNCCHLLQSSHQKLARLPAGKLQQDSLCSVSVALSWQMIDKTVEKSSLTEPHTTKWTTKHVASSKCHVTNFSDSYTKLLWTAAVPGDCRTSYCKIHRHFV